MGADKFVPRMAFRVGISGKQEGAEPARERIREVLTTVKNGVEAVRGAAGDESAGGRTYNSETSLLRAISPIAEGSDRIFAEEAHTLGYQLECPLPFRRVDYSEDFESPQSAEAFETLLTQAQERVFELDGVWSKKAGRTETQQKQMDRAYELAGRVVIDQCDLLIVVWDGNPVIKQGGTTHIREIARTRVPMVCLRIDGEPDEFSVPGVSLPKETVTRQLDAWLREVLEAPWERAPNPADQDVTGSYADKMKLHASLRGLLWRSFVGLMAIGCPASDMAERVPAGPFTDHYRHFDAAANRLVGLYRGSFLASYSLGVVAVLLALLGHLAPEYETVLSVAEFAVIVIVFAIVVTVLNQRLHYRSVDCRYLAEQFRVLCHVYPLGLTAPLLRLPAHLSKEHGGMSWMEWRLRALLRQTPMPSGVVSASYLAERQREVLDNWIRGQVVYHQRNHARMHCVEGRLDVMVWAFAIYAAIGCAVHLVHLVESPWLLLYTAGLPAAAAACHAIASQGELRRLSERSGALSRALTEIEKDLSSKAGAAGATLRVLREAAQEAATLIVEEVADWQILYRKPLPPP